MKPVDEYPFTVPDLGDDNANRFVANEMRRHYDAALSALDSAIADLESAKRRLAVAGDSDYRIDLGNAARSLSSAQHRASEFSATHTTSLAIAALAEQTKENTQ